MAEKQFAPRSLKSEHTNTSLPEIAPENAVMPESKSEDDWEKEIAAAKAQSGVTTEVPPPAPEDLNKAPVKEESSEEVKQEKQKKKPAPKKKQEETPVEEKQEQVEEKPVVEQPKQEPVNIEAEIERRAAERAKQLLEEEEKKKAEAEAKAKEEQKTEAERKIEEKKKRAVTDNNCAGVFFTDNGNDDDIEAAYQAADAEDTRDEQTKEQDPDPYVMALATATVTGQRNKQQRFLTRMINELEEQGKHVDPMINKFRLSKINPAFSDKAGPKRLSGATAQAAVLANTQGLYRVMLYNSGFWITIRPISVADADAFVREVDRNFKDLGRIIGGHYHLVMGVFLKRKVIDFLSSIVVGSNLDGWEDISVLADNISLQDYETILWAICVAMYRDGIGIGVYCTNPDCRYLDENQYVDLTNACFYNPDVFNADAVSWMEQIHVTRTPEALRTYREKILGGVKEIDNGDGIIYTVKVPSLLSAVTKGTDLIGEMSKVVNNAPDQKSEDLMNKITFHIYKMMAPWIAELRIKKSTGDIYINDYKAICLSLEAQIKGASKLYDKFEDFVRDTRCSFYGLTSLECPKCHKRPTLTKENIFPLDVEYVFFCLSCLLLEQTGIQS